MEKIDFKNILGIILIEADAGDVEGDFAFDTGAMQTSLNGKYFPELLGENKEVALFNEGMAVNGAVLSTLHELAFGNIKVYDLSVIRMDMDYVENALRTVEPDIRFLGSVGIEAFGGAAILLDYEHSVITVAPDVSDDVNVCGAEKLPLYIEGLPVVELEIAGETHRFVLDTGANTCLLSSELADRIDAAPLADSPGVYVVPEIKAGSRVYKNVNAVFTDISQIRERRDVDGVIGYQILSQQLSLLDFPNKALYLF